MTWNKEGIPHKGWHCIDVEDLADLVDGTEEIPYEQCEMCGKWKFCETLSEGMTNATNISPINTIRLNR